MSNKRNENDDETILHILFSTLVLILILLVLIIILLTDRRQKKILYDGDFFEIYQQGEDIYIWNKDIDGGVVRLNHEDPIVQHFFESELIPKESTPMGGEP